MAKPASAQPITLQPGILTGHIRFGNQDPAVLAILQSQGLGSIGIGMSSTQPAGFSASMPFTSPVSVVDAVYTISAQPATYTMNAVGGVANGGTQGFGGTGHGLYYFQPRTVTVTEGQTTTYDIEEVVGVHQINFGLIDFPGQPQVTPGTCATPVAIYGGRVPTPQSSDTLNGGLSTFYWLQRGGASLNTVVSASFGTDPNKDTISIEVPITFDAGPDQIKAYCVHVPEGGSGQLGAIRTPVAFAGHEVVAGSYLVARGPGANARGAPVNGNAPVTTPATWPFLQNLVPGAWSIQAVFFLDHGDERTFFQTAVDWRADYGLVEGRVQVPSGVTIDASQTFAGASRFPFVVEPAEIGGDILLADPYLVTHPGAASTLNDLVYAMDWVNPSTGESIRGPSGGTHVGSNGPHGALCQKSFGGRFDPVIGELVSPYAVPILPVYGQPEGWKPSLLNLFFASAAPLYNHDYINVYYGVDPAAADPAMYRFGNLTLRPVDTSLPALQEGSPVQIIQEGMHVQQDHSYCFNEVLLQVTAQSGLFVNPAVNVSGQGGTDAPYIGTGTFQGVPAVGWNKPTGVSGPFYTARASSGSVGLTLPSGTWKLTPQASFVDDTGKYSTGNFAAVSLTTGCGQRYTLVPGFGISLDAHAGCVDGATTLSGSTSGNPADAIWYTLGNDPTPHAICTGAACGSGAFSVPVTISQSTSVAVYATSAFVTGTVSATDTLTLCASADPCQGSAADVQPPVVTCPADYAIADTAAPTGSERLPTFTGAAATDVVSGSLPVSYFVGGSPIDPATYAFPLGTTAVLAEAVDACGNVGECSFDVKVAQKVCVDIKNGMGNVQDVQIASGAPTAHYAGQQPMAAGGALGARDLIRFDLSAIPAGATIVSGFMVVFQTNRTGTGQVVARNVTAPWTESAVTWSSFCPGGVCSVSPGYISPGVLSSNIYDLSVHFDMVAEAQAWVDGMPNYGILLEQTGAGTRTFRTSEDPTLVTSGGRPNLELCYLAP